MQLRFTTDLSAEEYVQRKAWKDAKLVNCPIHPQGGCGFAKNGTYSRKYPEGTKMPDGTAKWGMRHSAFFRTAYLHGCLES